MSPNPFRVAGGGGGNCTITTLDPELGLGGLLPQQLLASPSRPQTVLFADAAPRGGGGRVRKALAPSLASLALWWLLAGTPWEGMGEAAEGSFRIAVVVPSFPAPRGRFGWC